MVSEVELKLDVDADAANAIEQSPWLGGAPRSINQRSTYFDTPDRALKAAGLSLRVREADGVWTQTIKADDDRAAGLFARPEWEREVPDGRPVLDDATPIVGLIGDKVDQVAKQFEIQVERRLWLVDWKGASIEVAIDRGEVVAGERSARISELELELQTGSRAALFDFARRLHEIGPVRPGIASKAERGYRLSDAAPNAVKAQSITLTADMTAADAFRAIVKACVRHFRLNEDLLKANRHADALHQARVALRRLRSAFAIFKALAVGDQSDRLREELRWLAYELGEARNLDVLLAAIDAGPMRDDVARAREAQYDRVEAVLASARARRLLLDLVQWIDDGAWLDRKKNREARSIPARLFAERALARFRRKVKKGGRDLVRVDDETRHDVRKDAKKLRYACEFFVGLFDGERERRRYKKFVAALETLQDQLGALNDAATIPVVLDRLGLSGAAGVDKNPPIRSDLILAAADAYEDVVDTKRFWA
ncbi:CHAD domain-containing protein [Sphingomonas crocodyli]|uniref:Inorganic triphosphatase n=1 Tax=Sphingomonas crocodyli TaxID=1979270 RepID=A0A437LYJ8_9SPHN|nr:CHAD domain-containing protein [Sphingomonas crocodyli]RVT90491.1 inorganic triphosphatase [Sphingomonas crocodyli]